jgi:hypothetical protein
MDNAITTEHNLDFEVAEWHSPDMKLFRVGTCEGLWQSIPDCYVIVSIKNDKPGNGHFNDVLQWFEFSCKRDNKNLLVVELLNEKLYLHLITKRGFIPVDKRGDNVIKVFNQKLYKRMKKHGNEILLKGSLKCV